MDCLFLIIPVIFLTGYLLLYPYRRFGKLILAGTITISFVCLAAALAIVYFNEQRTNQARVFWQSVSSRDNRLTIGGDYDGKVVDWGTGISKPRLELTQKSGSSKLLAKVENAGAFIYNSGSQKFLNGKSLLAGESLETGGYKIVRNPAPSFFDRVITSEFEVFSESGEMLSSFSIRTESVSYLSKLIDRNINPKLNALDDESLLKRAAFAKWAADVLIIKTKAGPAYVLDKDGDSFFEIENAARLTFRSDNLKMDFQVFAASSDSKIELKFLPPFKHFSPLPPSIENCENKGSQFLSLYISSVLEPCQNVFQMPFGSLTKNLKTEIYISSDTKQFIEKPINEKSPAENLSNRPSADAENSNSNDISYKIPNRKVTVENCSTEKSISSGSGFAQSCPGLSKVLIETENYGFSFVISESPLSFGNLVLFAVLAWFLLIAGISLVSSQTDPNQRWTLNGIMLVLWGIFVFRLLLSLRHALNPDLFDRLVVNGIVSNILVLSVVPGLLLSLAVMYLRRQNENCKSWKSAAGYVILLASTAVFVSLFSNNLLWLNLPDNLKSSVATSKVLLTLFGSMTGVLLFFYNLKFDNFAVGKKRLLNVFIVSNYHYRNVIDISVKLWDKILTARGQSSFKLPVVFLLLNFLIVLLFYVMRFLIEGDKLVQETLIPLYFICLAIFWIGLPESLNRHPRASAKFFATRLQSFTKLFPMVLTTIGTASVLLPIAIKDFGSFNVAATLFLPLTVFFIIWKLKVALPYLITFGCVLMLGVSIYLVCENLTSYTKNSGIGVKRGLTRLLCFKDGAEAQNWLIYTNRLGKQGRLPYEELLNCTIHTWNNKAVIHQSGWLGKGYGNSPNQLSQIPQNMLLFDSVYSFFIVGEFGSLGGIVLLFSYALMFLTVFIAGRKELSSDYLLASVICASFLLEALYHVGMNLSIFPMSGRNLPLLSVYSPSDIIKWVIIFWLLIQAILFSTSRENTHTVHNSVDLEDDIETLPKSKNKIFTPKNWLYFGILFLSLTSLIYGSIIIKTIFVLNNRSLESFDYRPLLTTVNQLIERGLIYFDSANKKILFNEEKLKQLPYDPTFLREQAAQFNALIYQQNEDFRMRTAQLERDLGEAASLPEYQKKLRLLGEITPPSAPVNIFRLEEIISADNRHENIVRVNESFNNRLTLDKLTSKFNSPPIKIGEEFVVGPAWTKGTIKTATNSDELLFWAKFIPQGLSQIPKLPNNNQENVSFTEEILTLDYELQKASVNFTEEQGLKAHANLFSDARKGVRFPPMLALSIVKIPSGKTYALGSYPKVSSDSDNWNERVISFDNQTVNSWVPPLRWLENSDFKKLKTIYGQEHNFELSRGMFSRKRSSSISETRLETNTDVKIMPRLSFWSDDSTADKLLLSDAGTAILMRISPKIPISAVSSYSSNSLLPVAPPFDTRRSNIDFAGTFASYLTGKAVLPFILDKKPPHGSVENLSSETIKAIEKSFFNSDLKNDVLPKTVFDKLKYFSAGNSEIHIKVLPAQGESRHVLLAIFGKSEPTVPRENGLVISLQMKSVNKENVIKVLEEFLVRYESPIKRVFDEK